jgi:hypothetical protein
VVINGGSYGNADHLAFKYAFDQPKDNEGAGRVSEGYMTRMEHVNVSHDVSSITPFWVS